MRSVMRIRTAGPKGPALLPKRPALLPKGPALLVAALLLALTTGIVDGQAPTNVLVIEGGTLIDGNGGAPIRDVQIVVRGNRIAATLLSAAESHLIAQRVSLVRLGALSTNSSALSAYRKSGFAPYEIILEKRVDRAEIRHSAG